MTDNPELRCHRCRVPCSDGRPFTRSVRGYFVCADQIACLLDYAASWLTAIAAARDLEREFQAEDERAGDD